MTLAYRVWIKCSTGEKVRVENMTGCCRYGAEGTTSYEAEFICPVCETGWRAG